MARLTDLARSWRRAGNVPVIIDGGANVGYASLYFAAGFPDALVVAIEPDPASFALLRQNVGQFQNVRPVHGALWCDDGGVSIQHETSGSWATRTTTKGHDVPSWRLETLVAQIPKARVLILKLDIEGAERQVCEASPDTIRAAPCVMIEPHDYLSPGGACLAPLYRALAGKEVDTQMQGATLIFVDSALLVGK
jgi:FkbM family methyltransferase